MFLHSLYNFFRYNITSGNISLNPLAPGLYINDKYYLITLLIIYMKKFLHFDWLRAVQFLGNTQCQKKEIQYQKKKFSANFFRS